MKKYRIVQQGTGDNLVYVAQWRTWLFWDDISCSPQQTAKDAKQMIQHGKEVTAQIKNRQKHRRVVWTE